MNRRTALSLAGIAGLSLVAPVRADESTDANKETLRRYVAEVINGGNVDLLPELVAEDYVSTTPGDIAGIDALRARLEATRQSAELFYDTMEYILTDVIAEGDVVMARGRIVASRDGKSMDTDLMVQADFVDGMIRTIWNVFDPTQMF